jgi:hypothetical protein
MNLVLSLSLVATAPGTPLDAAIAAILAREELRGTHWGILVRNSSGIVYEHNSNDFFIPASNKKLLTAAAALTTHGSNFTFRTPLVIDDNSVAICGVGDPSISQSALEGAARLLTSGTLAKDPYVVAVAPTGYDQNNNPGTSSVDSWEWGDLTTDYGAQPSAFIVDALLPPNAAALGERMPNSMLIHITPGASVNAPATVHFASPAEGAFAKKFWEIESTVTTSAPGAPARVSYWYTLQNSKVLRLNGTVPSPSAEDKGGGTYKANVSGVASTSSAAPHAIKVATFDPATRAEGLLAYALREESKGNTTGGSGAVPAGPARGSVSDAAALQTKCARARHSECVRVCLRLIEPTSSRCPLFLPLPSRQMLAVPMRLLHRLIC